MTIGPLVLALAAAVAFGAAAVLQRADAAQLEDAPGVGLDLLWVLVHRRRYALGLVLDVLGFACSLAAVRFAPLYLVQPLLACSVAVTAVLASLVLGERLTRVQRMSLGGLVACLVVLGVTGRASRAPGFTMVVALVVVAIIPVALYGARAIERRGRDARHAAALGALAGVAFGMSDLAGRVIPPPGSGGVVAGGLYVVGVVGWVLVGLAAFGAGVRMSAATVVLVGTVVAETLLPAAGGLALGDVLPSGAGALCILAGAGALVCAVMIARQQDQGADSGALVPSAVQRVVDEVVR